MAAEQVNTFLSVCGYHVKFIRADSSLLNFRAFYDIIDTYEKRGYEIHAVALDYIGLMPREGCIGNNGSDTMRDLYRKIRNHCHPRSITFITAHQLSSEAKQLLRGGTSNFVKEIAGKSYWDGCKSLDQEVDLEIIQHIERPGDGHSYLTFQRGKHRKPGETPQAHQYCVYKFEEFGAIPDDIKGDCKALNKVGGQDQTPDANINWSLTDPNL